MARPLSGRSRGHLNHPFEGIRRTSWLRTLGHRNREAAKEKAEEVAAALRKAELEPQAEPTLQLLFDIYLREVTPEKGVSKGGHDRRAAQMFLGFVGADRKAATLNRRDWDGFIAWGRARRLRWSACTEHGHRVRPQVPAGSAQLGGDGPRRLRRGAPGAKPAERNTVAQGDGRSVTGAE